eukprot:3802953-Prymnesium_polylepis.1
MHASHTPHRRRRILSAVPSPLPAVGPAPLAAAPPLPPMQPLAPAAPPAPAHAPLAVPPSLPMDCRGAAGVASPAAGAYASFAEGAPAWPYTSASAAEPSDGLARLAAGRSAASRMR